MRAPVVKIATVWVIVAVVTSAVLTCVPGAMSLHATSMPGCTAMHEPGAAPSWDSSTTCCVQHEPALIAAKTELSRTSLQAVSPVASTANAFARFELARHLEPGQGASSAVGPPAFITRSVLRI